MCTRTRCEGKGDNAKDPPHSCAIALDGPGGVEEGK